MTDLKKRVDLVKERIQEQNFDNINVDLLTIINENVDLNNDDNVKSKETAIYLLSDRYRSEHNAGGIQLLMIELRGLFGVLPKAKTGKIVRHLIETLSKIPHAEDILIDMCRESIEWTIQEERTFLRLVLQTKLARALYSVKNFTEALELLSMLLSEAKKLDDKLLLVEIHLLESQIHHSLAHLPKSRASLTAARTAAHSIYCPPILAAELDLQSGILHAEEGDYKTSYSYFFEAYETYTTTVKEKEIASSMSARCLKYMLLAQIMSGDSDSVNTLINGKLAIQYAKDDHIVMRAIAKSHQDSSLSEFKKVIDQYGDVLKEDEVVQRHLQSLYQNLLEQNLLRIIEPFSRTQITHVAELIDLPFEDVEKKLSKMILDKKLFGTLDQAKDCLIVYDAPEEDEMYPTVLKIFDNLGDVVDSLFKKANKLN
jgi:26S proteasome regulatory subunit N6